MLSWPESLRRFIATTRAQRRYGHIERTPLRELAKQKAFEPELKLVTSMVEPGSGACLDVGAHIGHYTYVLAAHMGASNVYAFEPQPKSFKTLVSLFPGVQLSQLALSDGQSERQLRVPYLNGKECPTRASLEGNEEPGETGSETLSVTTNTVDAFVAERGIDRVAFLKIDVEGHEAKVLRGARHTLERHAPLLLVEIEQRHHDEPIEQIFAEVVAQGYAGYFFDASRFELRPQTDFDRDSMQSVHALGSAGYVNNFFFLPKQEQSSVITRVEAALARGI